MHWNEYASKQPFEINPLPTRTNSYFAIRYHRSIKIKKIKKKRKRRDILHSSQINLTKGELLVESSYHSLLKIEQKDNLFLRYETWIQFHVLRNLFLNISPNSLIKSSEYIRLIYHSSNSDNSSSSRLVKKVLSFLSKQRTLCQSSLGSFEQSRSCIDQIALPD